MVSCWFCGSPMRWDNDISFEDREIEGEGIISKLSCTNEECGATAEFFTKIEE